MSKDDIIRFPRPDDNLAPEDQMPPIAQLAEDVAEQMDTGGVPMDILGLLGHTLTGLGRFVGNRAAHARRSGTAGGP